METCRNHRESEIIEGARPQGIIQAVRGQTEGNARRA